MDSQGGLLGGGLLAALFLRNPWDELKARRLLSTHVLGLRLGSARAPEETGGREAFPLPPTGPCLSKPTYVP